MGGSIATASPTDLPVGDQPRALAPAARLHARARAWSLLFLLASLVMDPPKEVPKSAACGRSSTGRNDKLLRGFELLWRFSGDIR
jgi:hypothetical protein